VTACYQPLLAPGIQAAGASAMPSGGALHDAVVAAASASAARAPAVHRDHLRRGPARQLHQVALGAAAVQPRLAEMVPKPVRVQQHAALLTAPHHDLVDPAAVQRAAGSLPEPQLGPVRQLVPGPGPQVPVQPARGLVAELHRPWPSALPLDPDLAGAEIDIAAVRVVRVAADPGQLGEPDARRQEHRDDRRVAPMCERVAPARSAQSRKFNAGEARHRLARHLRRPQPGHGVGDLVLGGQPPEELLQRAELVAGVGLAV
jgi:hypothetical protein